MKIPSLILKQLYTFNSLEKCRGWHQIQHQKTDLVDASFYRP